MLDIEKEEKAQTIDSNLESPRVATKTDFSTRKESQARNESITKSMDVGKGLSLQNKLA